MISMIDDAGAVLDALEHVEHLRLDRHVERGRRLVRDEQVGVVGDRHRDHRPLPHAAGVLVRVLVDPRRRVRDADDLEQLDRPAARRSAPLMSWWTAIASSICLPTFCTGFSAASASWNTIAIFDAAQLLELLLGQPTRIGSPRNRTSPVIVAGARQQPEDRHRRDALARARLPHDAERLVVVHVERDLVHRLQDAVVGLELDA